MSPEARAALAASIDKHEGYRAEPYRDTLQLWTVGTGHLIHHLVIPSQCITCGELLDYLSSHSNHELWRDADIDRAIDDAARYLGNFDSQPDDVQRVVAEMAFQLGYQTLCKFSDMRTALMANDRQAAAQAGMNSLWAKQTPARAQELMDLLRGH